MYGQPNPLIGKTITAIHLAADRKAIKFTLTEGEPIIAKADGDCCSSTWIESLDTPGLIISSPVTAVEDLFFESEEIDYGLIQKYGCKIVTARGWCVIDYRNESNGYYGGSLSWPDDYFYGGVHGQNVSDMEWQEVPNG